MSQMQGTLYRRHFLAAAGLVFVAPMTKPTRAAGFAAFAPTGSASFDHSAFDQLLQRYVKADAAGYNRVDYSGFKREGATPLRSYIDALSQFNPVRLSRNEAHAFWINLYNAKTLDVILEHYPVASIKNIALGGGGLFKTGPWSRTLTEVNGTELSLDDIEHEIVRALFRDPMSHYGLNCASYSCPNLRTRVYTGRNITDALALNARDYVNHPRGVDVSDNVITASKIYSWYVEDFGGKSALKAHWKSLANADLAERIDTASLGSFVYDWSLNDV